MNAPLIRLAEPPRRSAAGTGFALWELGFRPFYLLASLFGALSIVLWALQFAGWLGGAAYLNGPLWHAHEMLFGFALAVVVGFLFTAGRNWTGRPTPTGAALAALAALWLAGRVLVVTPFGVAAALVNVAFPVAAAVGLAIPFWAARNRRNYFFVALLLMMAGAEAVVHLSQLGVVQLPGWAGIQLALDMLLFIMVVMAGRVLPMFTNNGVPGAGATKHGLVEKAALGSVLALMAVDALPLPPGAVAAVACVAALAHLVRWILWHPWKTGGNALVWVLHLAYAWVPLHLGLRALAQFGIVAPTLATHALTAGAAGGLIIGMMTRTALGHTGRLLRAGRAEVFCYALVSSAAAVRVLVPWAVPGWTVHAVLCSGALWSTGFALYALSYAPRLIRPRVDGLPG